MKLVKNNKIAYKAVDYLTYKFPRLFTDDFKYLNLRWSFQNPDTYVLNIREPVTFNDKMNWLKLNDHNPLYHTLVDKYEVKQYVAGIIGPQYVVPCYGVYDKFDDVNFENLPLQFVMKSTHDSSGAVICRDKQSFDKNNAQKHFAYSLSRNWYWHNREWAYKKVKPRIVVEQYLESGDNKELQDYKFWCFNGTPRFMYITNKGKNIRENFYDMSFNPVSICHGYQRVSPEFEKPACFSEMVELATMLSKGIPFVRIDFFLVRGRIYFSEYTFYDWGGLKSFSSYDQDLFLGNLLTL